MEIRNIAIIAPVIAVKPLFKNPRFSTASPAFLHGKTAVFPTPFADVRD